MADFAIALHEKAEHRSLARHLALTDQLATCSGSGPNYAWATSRLNRPDLWAPAWDPRSNTRLLLGGRLALEEHEWSAAETLPFEGGLAARYILSLWLEQGPDIALKLNGAGAVLVIEERHRNALLISDRMGFFPLFACEHQPLIIASHPDVVASLAAEFGKPCTRDDITIAEFLRTGAPTHPHTYWREVRQLDAGAIYQFSLEKPGQLRQQQTYWRPAYLDGAPPLSRNVFIEQFAESLRCAARRRSQARLGKVAVLLSAGADSRGVLFATREPSKASCFTYFDAPNPELKRATQLAAIAGAEHIALARDVDYYLRNAPETVRLSGGMWSIDSGHHTGFASAIRQKADPGVVLTGCYADYLFKGLALNTTTMKAFSRSLPLKTVSAYSHEFYLPFSPISPAFDDEVTHRLNQRYASAAAGKDIRVAESARLTPICREGDASGRLAMWRQLPIDPIFADRDILNLHGLQSVQDKLSGLAFGEAIARIVGRKAAAVPNNNFGAPVGGSASARVSSFLAASAYRKLRRILTGPERWELEGVATFGSWPDFRRVIGLSNWMRVWYESAERTHVAEYLSPDRRNWTLSDFAQNDVSQLLRLLTVSHWLMRQRADSRQWSINNTPQPAPQISDIA